MTDGGLRKRTTETDNGNGNGNGQRKRQRKRTTETATETETETDNGNGNGNGQRKRKRTTETETDNGNGQRKQTTGNRQRKTDNGKQTTETDNGKQTTETDNGNSNGNSNGTTGQKSFGDPSERKRVSEGCAKVEESVEYFHLAVFKGTYRHRIDLKGRVPVPAAFRRVLGGEGRVVVTQLDQCLAVYSPGEWSRLEAQLAALPAFSKPVKALTRLLASRAADCEFDVQGRILLPSALRTAVGLARDAVVIGVLNRFELWSPSAWDGFVRESERLLDDVSLDIQWPPPPPAPTGASDPPSGPPPRTRDPQANSNG